MQAYSNELKYLEKEFSYRRIYEIVFSKPRKTAARYIGQDDCIYSISYGEYKAKIENASLALGRALDGKTGSFIGLYAANSPDWPTLFWAILRSGNKALLLSANENEQSLRHLLQESGAIALIGDAKFAGISCIAPSSILKAQTGGSVPETFGDQVALCTSGTTGSSRIFVYDGNAMGHQIYSAKGFISKNKDLIYKDSSGPLNLLVCLPFSHIFGFIASFLWFSCGHKTLIYAPDMSPDSIFETCRRLKVTHVFCVPLFWNNIASGVTKKVKQENQKRQQLFDKMCSRSLSIQNISPRLGRALVSKFMFKKIQQKLLGTSIRFLISGGGHVLPETLRILNALGYPLYNGFGMTEAGITSVELSHNPLERMKGRVGKAFDTIEYKIDGSKKDGEILISGSSIHSGQMSGGKYIKREEEWFRTGDIGNLSEGSLYIDGRIKEVIVGESGINVYPDVVEDSFAGLAGVHQYCVLSLDTGSPYEDVTLVLELNKDVSPLEIRKTALTINSINQKLPLEKKVRMVLVTKDKLPLINGIKVQRQRLKYNIENGSHEYSVLDLEKRNLISMKYREIAKHHEHDERFLLLKETIRGIFADVLIIDKKEISDNDLFFEDLGGDSLTVIGLAAKIEDSLSVTIPFHELSAMMDINVFQLTEITYHRKYNAETSPEPLVLDA